MKDRINFEKYCLLQEGEEDFEDEMTDTPEPEFLKSGSLSSAYDHYMPQILKMVKNQDDIKQLTAKVHADLDAHPAASSSTQGVMDRARGNQLSQVAGIQDMAGMTS